MLRDRRVCGINDSAIQRRLLAEDKLSFTKAMEISQGMEASTKNVQTLHGDGEAVSMELDTGASVSLVSEKKHSVICGHQRYYRNPLPYCVPIQDNHYN